MTTFFTSDTHFDHESIIRLCNRPFSSAEEMNESLIKNWNDRITSKDTVYHLGDFYFKGQNPSTIFNRLNGRKHLVVGNHDSKQVLNLNWESVNDITEVKINHTRITLCHYSLRTWNKSYRGSWHLFGHSHGKVSPCGFSFDIGVDCHNFYPLSFDEVCDKMETLDMSNHPEVEVYNSLGI